MVKQTLNRVLAPNYMEEHSQEFKTPLQPGPPPTTGKVAKNHPPLWDPSPATTNPGLDRPGPARDRAYHISFT